MKIKMIRKVEFTEEEKKAINIIANADCSDIYCSDCPLNSLSSIPGKKCCVKAFLDDLSIREGFCNEQTN